MFPTAMDERRKESAGQTPWSGKQRNAKEVERFTSNRVAALHSSGFMPHERGFVFIDVILLLFNQRCGGRTSETLLTGDNCP
jgi:hypothetical protein